MATLVFTAIGTAIGGPLGGAIGSLIGNQLDRAVFGGGRREVPRLKELAVTTSSYGTLLVSDRDAGAAGIVYAISKNIFAPTDAYTAAPNSVAPNLR